MTATTIAVSTDVDHYLAAAPSFVERVADAADEIDAERQMPAGLAADMADAGFFRLLLPRELGGAELAHPDFLRILEMFAGADASVAWCLNQNNVFSTRSTRMAMSTAREIWGERRGVVTNGPPAAGSKSVPVSGGYQLSGHWNFSSGSDHATWIAALAPVMPENGSGVDGRPPQMRLHLMPIDQVRMVDLWQVAGLRGTGSFSFQVDNHFVSEEHTFVQEGESWCDGPLYGIPTTLLFATGFATVALGVARKSLDIAIEGGSRMPYRGGVLLRDQQTTQRAIGEAHALHSSARAFLRESHARLWESACTRGAPTIDERIQLRVAATHAIRTSAQVVDTTYTLCGSGAIFQTNPIQRRFQDIHVITQHTQGHYMHYETAGQYLLGLDPQGVF